MFEIHPDESTIKKQTSFVKKKTDAITERTKRLHYSRRQDEIRERAVVDQRERQPQRPQLILEQLLRE